MMPQIETRRPGWTYFLFAATDVLGRVLTARFSGDGRDGHKPAAGVNVGRLEELKPGIQPEMITSTTVIGQRVLGSDGKALGKIEEVALDLTTGVISYLVLAVGGVFGFADKLYAVPLNYLTMNPEEKVFYLDMDKKKLKQMPQIDKYDWPRKTNWPEPPDNTANANLTEHSAKDSGS
jgi:sporulation protein YlmC with PRC-barrel domain